MEFRLITFINFAYMDDENDEKDENNVCNCLNIYGCAINSGYLEGYKDGISEFFHL